MDLLSILLVALGLAMDCFVVAVGGSISMQSLSYNQVLRASFSFGFFQFAMAILGWLAGQTVAGLTMYDHWVAFTLLLVVGTRMIWETLPSKGARRQFTEITKGVPLLTLSVATSIDALAVGLTFAFLKVNFVLAVVTIGIVSFVVTIMGFILGRKAGRLIGRRAETIGGLILIAIGLRILISHLL